MPDSPSGAVIVALHGAGGKSASVAKASGLADSAGRFGLHPGRLCLTGMANGAMLAETHAMLRGIKVVAGVAGTPDLTQAPAAPVPLLHIHGSADQVVPHDGGHTWPGGEFRGRTDQVSATDAILDGFALHP